ncbi:MAG: mechanosensitive ion channel family protein, partial [Pseudomonadota bacterium]
LKGFFQVAKIVIYCVGAVLVIAAVFNRSPLLLFSGLGALTAVLILVFKDTLMSLVASVQIASTGILRLGDWVEMPQYGADGDVIDIALHTVSVQNWDKTVTTIPTHRFISDSFKNWRFMSLSGGRRIKRALNVDLGTVRFLTPTEVDRFREFALLRDYIDDKRESLRVANADFVDDGNVNARRLTNLGTFRAYMVAYLRNHPGINKAMTLIVRQLDPTPHGIPLELYAFTDSTEWVEHERVKSDVFDHLIAIAQHFDLKVFQSPTGNDITGLGEHLPRT